VLELIAADLSAGAFVLELIAADLSAGAFVLKLMHLRTSVQVRLC